MGRWEPDGRGRLALAALQLYRENGYDRTTVAEIAARAGLSERTFFRHFTDKREVLFGGSEQLRELMVASIAAAPSAATPLEAVGLALDAVGAALQPGREHSQTRQQIIDSTPELRERELIKLASLASAMAAALRARGVKDPAASLAADAGISIFRVAFTRWIEPTNRRTLGRLMRDHLRQLQAVAAG